MENEPSLTYNLIFYALMMVPMILVIYGFSKRMSLRSVTMKIHTESHPIPSFLILTFSLMCQLGLAQSNTTSGAISADRLLSDKDSIIANAVVCESRESYRKKKAADYTRTREENQGAEPKPYPEDCKVLSDQPIEVQFLISYSGGIASSRTLDGKVLFTSRDEIVLGDAITDAARSISQSRLLNSVDRVIANAVVCESRESYRKKKAADYTRTREENQGAEPKPYPEDCKVLSDQPIEVQFLISYSGGIASSRTLDGKVLFTSRDEIILADAITDAARSISQSRSPLKSMARFQEDRESICSSEWTTRGVRDQRMYQYCLTQQTEAYVGLSSFHNKHSAETWYAQYAYPYCDSEWTKREVSDARMILYCLNQEFEGYQDVQYSREQYNAIKVDQISAQALADYKSWRMAAYEIEKYFDQ